jgi:hypothetical protein
MFVLEVYFGASAVGGANDRPFYGSLRLTQI